MSKSYFHSDEEVDVFEGFEVLRPDKKEPKRKKKEDDERIEASSGDEDSETERALTGGVAEEDEDDDEASEAVTFDQGREETLQRVRQVMAQLQADKQRAKRKRKQQTEMLKAQKEKTLAQLEKNRLPEDFVNSIEQPTQKASKAETKAKKSKFTDELEGKRSDQDEDSNTGDMSEDGDDEMEDFIALEKDDLFGPKETVGGVQAVPVRKVQQIAKKSSEAALNFKQKQLYGGRIKRHSVQYMKAVKAKQETLKFGKY